MSQNVKLLIHKVVWVLTYFYGYYPCGLLLDFILSCFDDSNFFFPEYFIRDNCWASEC